MHGFDLERIYFQNSIDLIQLLKF